MSIIILLAGGIGVLAIILIILALTMNKADNKIEGNEQPDYLSTLAARISHDDKLAICTLIEHGQKIEAIDKCRKASGAGLKDAKDMVENYMQYLRY